MCVITNDAICEIIRKGVPPIIKAVLVTRTVEGIIEVEYQGEKYFIVNKITWLQIEHYFRPRTPEPGLIGYSASWIGIPIIEDDKLVMDIMRAVLQKFVDRA